MKKPRDTYSYRPTYLHRIRHSVKQEHKCGNSGNAHAHVQRPFAYTPLSTRFYQHNECSRYTRFPSNIRFYCVKQAPQVS
ncbi:hypothetical protein LX36DRAFT_656877 [Colletotrichum falcatum]|nr:hypothetical protein LX36DRAFT_656877 [Colletotrichum falcatum]